MNNQVDLLKKEIEAERSKLLAHPAYKNINDLEGRQHTVSPCPDPDDPSILNAQKWPIDSLKTPPSTWRSLPG